MAGNEARKRTEELKAYAKSVGVDLIGIAGIGRFDGVAPEHHPSSIFPEAKSVIVLGKRIVRGALRGVEEGTQIANYRMYGYSWLENRFLAVLTFKVAEYLEHDGWEAIPIANLPPQIPAMGVPVAEGKPAPNVMVDVDAAAVRAGLGEIGYLNVFLSPQFGPRQRLQAIITDAELLEDPLFSGEICDRSKELASLCPLQAIDASKEQVVDICGKKMKVATINYKRCRGCQNGAAPNRHHPAGLPDRIAAVCMRSDLERLEKQGRLANKFNAPFRKREAWTVLTPLRVQDAD